MGAFALKWILNNKLAAVFLLATIACGTALFFSRTHIAILKLENTKLEEQNLRKAAALERLEALGELQKDRLTAAEREIAKRKRAYDKVRQDLAKTQIPVECPEAVTWGSDQINGLIEGLK